MILDCEIEKLAKELHKFYRATLKGLRTCGASNPFAIGHDHGHGWSRCHKKKYFLRRAKALANTMNDRDYSKLPKHMQSMQQPSTFLGL